MSTRDITEAIKDVYGVDVSATMISKITDKIIPLALDRFTPKQLFYHLIILSLHKIIYTLVRVFRITLLP